MTANPACLAAGPRGWRTGSPRLVYVIGPILIPKRAQFAVKSGKTEFPAQTSLLIELVFCNIDTYRIVANSLRKSSTDLNSL